MLQTSEQRHLHSLPKAFSDPTFEARLSVSPVTAEGWRRAVYGFVAAQTYAALSVWFALPASSDAVSEVAVKLRQQAARECQQPKRAAVAFMSVMDLLVSTGETLQDNPALGHQFPAYDVSLSPSITTMCSMLLVLQTIAVLDHTSHDTLAARSDTVKVLSLIQEDLPDASTAQDLRAAQPPGVNASLVVKIVQQVLPLLHQALKQMPSAARVYLDILLQMCTLAPANLVADELVQHGRLLFWSSRTPLLACYATWMTLRAVASLFQI